MSFLLLVVADLGPVGYDSIGVTDFGVSLARWFLGAVGGGREVIEADVDAAARLAALSVDAEVEVEYEVKPKTGADVVGRLGL